MNSETGLRSVHSVIVRERNATLRVQSWGGCQHPISEASEHATALKEFECKDPENWLQ